MGRPDQTEKMLLDLNDEFAEVFSAFACKNKLKLNPDALHEAVTEYHHLELGKPKELRRDIVKRYDGLKLGIIVLGIENQSEVDPMMPIRMMGYDWTRYRYQMCHVESQSPQTMLSPVFRMSSILATNRNGIGHYRSKISFQCLPYLKNSLRTIQ